MKVFISRSREDLSILDFVSKNKSEKKCVRCVWHWEWTEGRLYPLVGQWALEKKETNTHKKDREREKREGRKKGKEETENRKKKRRENKER